MKIFDSSQIQYLDKATLKEKKLPSFELMENASLCFTREVITFIPDGSDILIIPGPGNNGGDGWCIARMLAENGYSTLVLDLSFKSLSPDNERNKSKYLKSKKGRHILWEAIEDIPKIDFVIDALFGTGLDRPLDGEMVKIVRWVNALPSKCISVDIPSGFHSEKGSIGPCIEADYTVTFQSPKLSFFFSADAHIYGNVKIVDIGLSRNAIDSISVDNYWVNPQLIHQYWNSRSEFGHKGDYGRALIIAGSRGMMGACILATEACLRCGIGLLTVHVPNSFEQLIHSQSPEALISGDTNNDLFTDISIPKKISVVAIGPGLGMSPKSAKGLSIVLSEVKCPLIIDADAINIIAKNEWTERIPKGSILTPHVMEFDRLFGRSKNERTQWKIQRSASLKFGIYILVKGKNTRITTPNGETYFDNSGNPGLSKGGSGDVLTGMIAGLVGRMGNTKNGLLTASYLHGKAADIAAHQHGFESMIGRDVIGAISSAFIKNRLT